MRASQPSELTVDWFENFHLSNYQPMHGLLAKDDFQFLSRQPGFDPSLYRKLRRDRLLIFREYFTRLIADYNRLHALAGFIISQSEEDQSRLYGHLISLRLRFWLATLQVEFSYQLCRLGMRSLSVSTLLAQLEQISNIAMLPPAKQLLMQ
jgi:hypothetical protein